MDPNPRSPLLEDLDGIWFRRNSVETARKKIFLPLSIWPPVLSLSNFRRPADHPIQTRMHQRLCRVYYGTQICAAVNNNIREWVSCASNRVRLLKKARPMNIFQATSPLESLEADILVHLPKGQRGFRFILVISNCLRKLTQVVNHRRVRSYNISVEVTENWVFK